MRTRLHTALAIAALALGVGAGDAAARRTAQIAFDHDLGIFTMDANGSRMKRLTEGEGYGVGPYDFQPKWSPDARLIAFDRNELDEPYGTPESQAVWVVRTDGSHDHAVGPAPGPDDWDSVQTWTEDGRIVFIRDRLDENREVVSTTVYAVDPDGRHLRKLVNASRIDFSNLEISPDGRRFLYDRRQGDRSDLWTMKLNGSDRRRLRKNGFDGSWSPNGRNIVFSRGADRGSHLFRIRADGSHPEQLTIGRGYHYGADWSPDGARIVFENYNGLAAEAEESHVHSIGTHGRCNVRLTHGIGYNGSPAWRPARGDDSTPERCR
jgi:Tol biopolymer transport system component